MSKRNFQFTENEAKAMFITSSLTNVIDAFLQNKFGKEYIDFRMSTIERWLEASRKEREARASGAQTTNNIQTPTNDEAAQ